MSVFTNPKNPRSHLKALDLTLGSHWIWTSKRTLLGTEATLRQWAQNLDCHLKEYFFNQNAFLEKEQGLATDIFICLLLSPALLSVGVKGQDGNNSGMPAANIAGRGRIPPGSVPLPRGKPLRAGAFTSLI